MELYYVNCIIDYINTLFVFSNKTHSQLNKLHHFHTDSDQHPKKMQITLTCLSKSVIGHTKAFYTNQRLQQGPGVQ